MNVMKKKLFRYVYIDVRHVVGGIS